MTHELVLRIQLNYSYSKETIENYSDLNGSPKQGQQTHDNMSHVVCLEYFTGTCKNNIVQK
jgi:hypothetical protein